MKWNNKKFRKKLYKPWTNISIDVWKTISLLYLVNVILYLVYFHCNMRQSGRVERNLIKWLQVFIILFVLQLYVYKSTRQKKMNWMKLFQITQIFNKLLLLLKSNFQIISIEWKYVALLCYTYTVAVFNVR